MIRPLPVALALVLAAPLAAQSADAPAHRTPVATGLVLKPSAEVTGDSVLLRDVADLPDDCPWAAVEIGPAPLPGRQRTITAPQVELRLDRAGFAAEAGPVGGAGEVVITRTARIPGAVEIQQALADLLPFEVGLERLPPRRPLPAGELGYRLTSPLPNPLPERFVLNLDLLVDGQVRDRLSLAVRRLDTPAVPASPARPDAPLAPGSPVAPEIPAGTLAPASPAVPDATPAAPAATPVVEVPELYSSGVPTPAPSPTPAVAAGEPVAAPALPAWVVKRGDRLTVMAVAGSVRISLAAEARGSGTLGDLIPCETRINNERRTLSARLIAPDRAILEF